jgi:hypothetical protein
VRTPQGSGIEDYPFSADRFVAIGTNGRPRFSVESVARVSVVKGQSVNGLRPQLARRQLMATPLLETAP